MVTRKDSSAFPYLEGEGGLLTTDGGLTKREFYAAYALMGLLANPSVDGTHEDIAIDALDYTDALIAQLNAISPRS